MTKAGSLAVVAGAYLVAGAAAWATVAALGGGHHPLTVTFWADIVATLVIFVLSTVVRNASLYDPYWSVAPAVVVVAWGIHGRTFGVPEILVLIWSVRLTGNWVRSWRGLDHEDWRYVQLREQSRGRLPFWLVNLVGIQLVPTLVVFAGLLAAWPAVMVHGPWLLGTIVTAGAIVLETVADRQLQRFTADPANRGRVIESGLWGWSRHPNYLGEILFWWGLWIFTVTAAPHWWWTVAGPIAMVLLFALVSVPMMDRRSLARRPAYAEVMARIPPLLPRRAPRIPR